MERIIFLVVVVFLSGCGTRNVYTPQDMNVSGAYKNDNSGMLFPEYIDNFKRVRITKFSEDSKNIGVGYNNSLKNVAITIYNFPEPKVTSFGSPQDVIDEASRTLFNNLYEYSKSQILSAHLDGKVISDSEYKLTQKNGVYSGYQTSFKYEGYFFGRYQALSSHLYLLNSGGYIVKYRITHPDGKKVKQEINDFISSLVINSAST